MYQKWAEGDAYGYYELKGRFIDNTDNSISEEISIPVTKEGTFENVEAAYCNGYYLIVAADVDRLEGIVLSKTGIAGKSFRVGPSGSYGFYPFSIAAGRETFCICWIQYDRDLRQYRILKRQLLADGNFQDTEPIAVSDWIPLQETHIDGPSVAYNGTYYFFIWDRQQKSGKSYSSSIVGKRMLENGEFIDDSEITIYQSYKRDDYPQAVIERTPDNNFILAYTRFDDRFEYRNRRVKIRYLQTQ